MSDYFLGVDGGQSGTIAAIGDATGRIAGLGRAGPCNHVGTDAARAKFGRVLRECISQAAGMAGLDAAKPRFRSACFGMSGGPEDKQSAIREVMDAERLEVTHDARIALAGALAGEPGIIVIAGTGSIAFGENASGKTARAGGWGYVFGDEGGGFDIVRRALRAALREHEGWGPSTALTPALLEATNCADANEALHAFYTEAWPRARTAALSVLVNEIGESGDSVAVEILHGAAGALAALTRSVGSGLWRAGETSQVSWAGGVFRSSILLERFRSLAETEYGVTTAPPRYSPVLGALTIAWRSAGMHLVPIEPVSVEKN